MGREKKRGGTAIGTAQSERMNGWLVRLVFLLFCFVIKENFP